MFKKSIIVWIILNKQEARSKFEVDIEPASAVELERSSGYLNPDGSASIYFKRASPSPSTGRINCKVQLFWELFMSLLLNTILTS